MQEGFAAAGRILAAMKTVVVGKDEVLELVVAALLAQGHILLEDLPGLGKTLIARSLAKAVGGSFHRVQFTPDLMPSDITGFNIFDQARAGFSYKAGPVMTNVLLADEINRAMPRTQSSLLECMAEAQVTVDGVTMRLPEPFFVIATQNPIELQGTYPLPEAQLDRFLIKTGIGYPTVAEELAMMDRFIVGNPEEAIGAVTSPAEVAAMQRARAQIHVSDAVRDYIARIVHATRKDARLAYGSSPRGSLALMRAGQALAALRGRDYVLPDDVRGLVIPVLGHRIILDSREALRGSDTAGILEDILKGIRVQPVLP